MRILLTGATGQLGRACQREFGREELFLATSQNFNLTTPDQWRAVAREFCPEVIIHAGAYTSVKGAESDPEGCYRVNALGTLEVAALARTVGAVMVYISTDYVFDGRKERPYREEDQPHPRNVYGRSKLAGELAVSDLVPKYFILRTSWLYGEGKNFIRAILGLAEKQPVLKVVADQYGCPTFAQDLAGYIRDVLKTEEYGIYHAANQGQATWADLATTALSLRGKTNQVVPISSLEMAQILADPTDRPPYTVLATNKLGRLTSIRPWPEALAEYLKILSPP